MNADMEDMLVDLIARMEGAEAILVGMAEEHTPLSDDRKRLTSKANGVALARTYVADQLRQVRA